MSELRIKAEEIYKQQPMQPDNLSELELQKLVQELQIHQIELQVQNEELRSSRLELETAHKKYFNLFDLAPVGYLIIDTKAIILELNLKATEIFDRRKEYIINHPLVSLLEASSMSGFYEFFQLIKVKQTLEPFEFKINKANSYVYIELSVSPYINETYLAVLTDITERKTNELKLQKSEAHFHSIFDNSQNAIFLLDNNGKYLSVNRTYLEMTGYEMDEIIDNNGGFITFPDDSGQIKRALLKILRQDINSYSDEIRIVKKDNSTLWISLKANIHFNTSGEFEYILGTFEDIDKRKRFEIALNESEVQYRNLADSGMALIWTSGTDKLCNYFNEPWLQFTGRSMEQEMGKGWTEGVHPDDFDFCLKTYVAAFEKREPFNMEYRLRHFSGEYKWLMDKGTPNYNINGVFLGYIGHCFDISELKQAEQELRKLKIAVDQSPVTIIITDTTGKIEYINPAFSQSSGYTIEEAKGENPRFLKSNKNSDDVYNHLWKTISSGNTWQGEFINKKKDGQLYTEQAIISPVIDEFKKITHYISIKTDITQRKQQDEIIKLNNERLHNLLLLSQMKETEMQIILERALAIAIQLTKSTIGYIYHYSEEKKQFTLNSWSTDVMKDCGIVEQQTIYDLEKTGIWGDVVRERKFIMINDYQVNNPAKKGYPEGHMELTRFLSIPVFSNNEIVAVIGVGNKPDDYDETDVVQLNLLAESVWAISRQKEDEQKIRILADELTKLNANKDKFFSIIAHDLKSPFNSLLGYSNLLLQNFDKYSDEKKIKFIKTIYESSNKTFALLENLLEWSRFQRDAIVFNPQIVNLQNLVKEAIVPLESVAEKKNINIHLEVTESQAILADRNMVLTIVRNLISNAIKFTVEAGSVTVASQFDENEVLLCICDTGIGISDETKKILFKVDSKQSSVGTNGETGTGLGLVLCKEFVEKHGGKIWVESELGIGSKFKFTLPNRLPS